MQTWKPGEEKKNYYKKKGGGGKKSWRTILYSNVHLDLMQGRVGIAINAFPSRKSEDNKEKKRKVSPKWLAGLPIRTF